MFSYHLNCRILDPQEEATNAAFRVTPVGDGDSDRIDNGSPACRVAFVSPPKQELTKYPLIWIPRAKKVAQTYKKSSATGSLDQAQDKSVRTRSRISDVETTDEVDSHFQVDVQLDFGKWFTWLERGIWLTMFASIVWALAIDTSKAVSEVCFKNGKPLYPFNFLPSLSRTMGSFRIGTLFWTVCMAAAFIGRLLSNYFLHRMYEAWYDCNLCNTIYLRVAYYLDNLEILSLIMIPAYSLDCDWMAHRAAFIAYLVLTSVAELLQYFTRFLPRKKGLKLDMEEINKYYRQIGILIILQVFFLLWMLAGFLLHEYVCGDLYFTLFTLGEYFTVIVNVRFKRDTILFVR